MRSSTAVGVALLAVVLLLPGCCSVPVVTLAVLASGHVHPVALVAAVGVDAVACLLDLDLAERAVLVTCPTSDVLRDRDATPGRP